MRVRVQIRMELRQLTRVEAVVVLTAMEEEGRGHRVLRLEREALSAQSERRLATRRRRRWAMVRSLGGSHANACSWRLKVLTRRLKAHVDGRVYSASALGLQVDAPVIACGGKVGGERIEEGLQLRRDANRRVDRQRLRCLTTC